VSMCVGETSPPPFRSASDRILEPGAWSLEDGAWRMEPGAWSLEPRGWSLPKA